MEMKPLLKRGGGPFLSSHGVAEQSFFYRSFASTVPLTFAEFFVISDFVVAYVIFFGEDYLLNRIFLTVLFEVEDTIEAREMTGPFTTLRGSYNLLLLAFEVVYTSLLLSCFQEFFRIVMAAIPFLFTEK